MSFQLGGSIKSCAIDSTFWHDKMSCYLLIVPCSLLMVSGSFVEASHGLQELWLLKQCAGGDKPSNSISPARAGKRASAPTPGPILCPWQVSLTNHATLPAEPGCTSSCLSPQSNSSKQQCWGRTNLSLSPEKQRHFTQHYLVPKHCGRVR